MIMPGSIDKIKQFEETLADLEGYIKQLWDFLPVPVGVVNPQGFVLSGTRALFNFSGYEEIEIIGKHLQELLVGNKKIKRFLVIAKRRKTPLRKEMVFVGKKGQRIPVEFYLMRREDENGEFIGYFFSVIDISERVYFEKRLKKEVEKKTRQLQEQLEQLEKFRRLTEGRELRMIELKKELEN